MGVENWLCLLDVSMCWRGDEIVMTNQVMMSISPFTLGIAIISYSNVRLDSIVIVLSL